MEPSNDNPVDQSLQPRAAGQRFAVPARRVFRSVCLGTLALIGGFVASVFGIVGLLQQWGGWIMVPTYLLILFPSIISTISGAAALQWAAMHCGERIIVVPRGLVRLRKSKRAIYRWDEIASLKRVHFPQAEHMPGFPRWFTRALGVAESVLPMRNLLMVHRTDGTKLRLDDFFVDVANLIEIVQHEVALRIWPELFARFTAGDSLDFGEIRIDRQGATRGDRTVEWQNVQELRHDRFCLCVYAQGQRVPDIVVGYDRIPNLHVFLALAKHALNRAGNDVAPITIHGQ